MVVMLYVRFLLSLRNVEDLPPSEWPKMCFKVPSSADIIPTFDDVSSIQECMAYVLRPLWMLGSSGCRR